MCGIAGLTRFHSHQNIAYSDSQVSELLEAMGKTIFHRGPDNGGTFVDENIGLCHRRLSIIDLSPAGNQPMLYQHEQTDLVMVFNGEIYNFEELRAELKQQGFTLNTHTDSEVILALYARDGVDCLKNLNGMFAFAIWDQQKQELFLARDRLGKKPLYYFDDGKSFIFASEIKAILEAPEVKREVRSDAVYDFFSYQYIPDPKTIYKNIYKLKPGHWMTVSKKSGINIKKYWDVSFAPPQISGEAQVCNELYQNIESSVKQRMVADVPLGAFLSGGIDSSAVVGLMANNSKTPVTTCAIGFDSKKFDEVDYARQVAEKFSTDHHEFTVKGNVADSVEAIARYFDEPFADPSFVPTYFVSKLARQKVTVALAGDGGDENFAGYTKYSIDNTENKIRKLFPKIIRETFFPPIASLLSRFKNPVCRKGSTLLNTLSVSPSYGFFLSNCFFSEKLWDQLLQDDLREKLGNYHPSKITEDYYNNSDAEDHLGKILYTDIKTYLTGDVLTKVDRMSMANSLEVRAPLLDFNVVEYAAKIASPLKFNDGEKKYALKKAFASLLPHDILYRKKMGFSVPLADWLRSDLKELFERYIFNSNSGIKQFFKPEEIQKVWRNHQSGQSENTQELWSMLIFELWWQNYMDE